jgi:hypothetical protein
VNEKFFKLRLLKQCLAESSQARETLFNDLVSNASDSNLFKQRVETFSLLSQRESELIKKILEFETDDVLDFDIDTFRLDQLISH